jgi:glycine/D-amino acid oxidase-like deaminating enzyme
VRIGIVGTGLAGTLLAWRLRRAHPRARVALFAGPAGSGPDATAVSGGLVRGFEEDAGACRLAAQSLAELVASPVLRDWAGYTATGSLYLLPADPEVKALLDIIDAELPGSARLLEAAEVQAAYPMRNLAADTVGVAEERGGYLSPARLREAVLADLAAGGVEALPGGVVAVSDRGCVRADGRTVGCDVVVVAAGRWTGHLLAASGLPAGAMRTKMIQYSVHRTATRLPAFLDATSGLYGRSLDAEHALLGVPSKRWDVPPAGPDLTPDPALAAEVARVAAWRLAVAPLGPAVRVVPAADSYTEPAGLALREVVLGRVFTFAGGSGAAVKTALAASRAAASQVAGDRTTPVPAPHGGSPAAPLGR